MSSPRLIVVAGPNGAGKSTFYRAFLRSSGLPFLNADEIGAKLRLSAADAARAADAVRAELVQAGKSFVTETVFSDPVGAKLQLLRNAQSHGFAVHLIYIGLASAQLSEARVIQRVGEGGHDVPSERLFRRYRQSLLNLRAAMAFVPSVHVFDNSLAEDPYRLVLEVVEGIRVDRGVPLPAWLAEPPQ